MSTSFRAIIGLGNPGPSYVMHRHNIGFRVLDELVKRAQGTWRVHGDAATTEIMIHGTPILCIKPLTGMNLSGKVIPMLRKKGITPEQTIIVHDELEIAFGKIMVKQGGSARGHNGLRSFIAAWGENFYRIRCGVGRPPEKESVPTYVLSSFSESPSLVDALIHNATIAIENLINVPQQ